MNASRFVGRVGGLAVVLGVGVSLGQGLARADDTSQTGPSSGSSTSVSSPAGSDSSRSAQNPPRGATSHRGAPTATTTHTDSGADSAGATAKQPAAGSSTFSSGGVQQPGQPKQSGNNPRTAQTGNDSSTTEAPTDDPSSASTHTPGDRTAPSNTTPDTTTGAYSGDGSGQNNSSQALTATTNTTGTSTGGSGGSDHRPSPDPVKQNPSPASAADTTPAPQTTSGQASTMAVAGKPASGHDAAGAELTTTVAPDTTRPGLSPHVDAAAALSPVSDPTQAVTLATTPAPVTLQSIVTDVLTWIGLATLAPYVPVPDLPVPSVFETLWLAVREFQRTYNNQRPTTQLTLSAPGPDGIIVGSLNATDFENDPLTYTVTTAPTRGTVTLDPDGDFTYTPGTQTAATGAPDSFTVTIDDGAQHGLFGLAAPTTVNVALNVARTGVTLIGANVTLSGYLGGQVFTPDGTRVVITSDATNWDSGSVATQVAVVNTTTGTQVGTTLTLTGGPLGSPLLNADGTRAVITTQHGDTQVVVIDTATGKQIGTTLTLAGQNALPTVLSADGTRALLTTTSSDLVTGGTRVAVIDTNTGAQIGTTLTLPGYRLDTWSADGTHVLLTTTDGDSTTGFTTRVAVIDTATGTQTGTALTLPGHAAYGSVSFSADGSRALITTDDYDSTGGSVTRVAVINTNTGAQTGTTLTLTGSSVSALMTAEASRALITTRVDDTATDAASTLVTLIDATTGAQIGNTVTLAGAPWSAPISADGSRALITTYVAAGYTILNTQVSVINTTTGAQTGTTLTLTGRQQGSPVLSADGAHALIATDAGVAVIINTTTGTQTGATLSLTGEPKAFELVGADSTRALITTTVTNSGNAIEDTTLVKVIDTTTGTQIGTTLTLPGSGAPLLSADGSHALITTAVYDRGAWITDDPHSTRVAVIDTTTGQQTGTTLTMPGAIYGAQLLSADGTHALITTSPWNPVTYTPTTQMAVINTTTGKQVGGTLTLAGGASGEPLFSADGTHILITTAAPINGLTQTITRVAVLQIV